jgi:hypothetical protein
MGVFRLPLMGIWRFSSVRRAVSRVEKNPYRDFDVFRGIGSPPGLNTGDTVLGWGSRFCYITNRVHVTYAINIFDSQRITSRIAIILAGRVAEKVKYGDVSTGAGDDLKKATQLARNMVCQWGMSDELGPVAFKKGETHPFLGRELAETRDYSEHTAWVIDEEVKHIVLEREEKTYEALNGQPALLDALAAALLEHETLSHVEIDAVLQEAGMTN